MENNIKSFKIDRIIFAVGALVIGIILLVWPSTSLLIMGKCLGAFLAGGGIVAAFMFFQDHESVMKSVLLIMAAVMLICGSVIFLQPDDLVKLIPTIMGILVLISGLINLGETFLLTRSKYSKWWVSLIVSIITIAAGIFLIRNAFNLASLITRIAGGILIFDGVSDLWVISRISKAQKDAEAEASAVDVTASVNDSGSAEGAAQEQPGTASNMQGTDPAAPQNVPEAKEEKVQDSPSVVVPTESTTASEETPEYMKQTEQDTDYSAFSAEGKQENKPDEEKPAQ